MPFLCEEENIFTNKKKKIYFYSIELIDYANKSIKYNE